MSRTQYISLWALPPLVLAGVIAIPAHSQETPVTPCDTYAAHQSDPDRKASGVSWSKLDPEIAIPACEDGLAKYPDDPRFIFQLGRSYHSNGDIAKAIELYTQAAEQGYSQAQTTLGRMYFEGVGVAEDYAKAVHWWGLAVQQGNPVAANNLGVAYHDESGGARNYVEAVRQFRLAAESGDPFAQFNLGLMYRKGRGVREDAAEAAKWYRLAAKQGLAKAQNSLGELYRRGLGVPRDFVAALAWFILADESGDEDAAKGKAFVKSLMSSAQITEARNIARERREKHQAAVN
jgi:TPR repeat protein